MEIDYARQSAHNHDAQKQLSRCPSQYIDWEITTLFYSAVHVINGYLLSEIGITPHSHKERNELVEKEIKPIWPDYHTFYILCKKVRYSAEFDSVTEGERQLALRLHNSICDHVRFQSNRSDPA